MDVLTQLLQPYRGWDPRLQKPRVSTVSAGRHAGPVEAPEGAEQESAPTVYFRAGRRRAVVVDAAPADGQAV